MLRFQVKHSMSLVLKTLQGIVGSKAADGRGINSFSIAKPWFWMQQAALDALSEERGVVVITRLPQALVERAGLTTDLPEVCVCVAMIVPSLWPCLGPSCCRRSCSISSSCRAAVWRLQTLCRAMHAAEGRAGCIPGGGAPASATGADGVHSSRSLGALETDSEWRV